MTRKATRCECGAIDSIEVEVYAYALVDASGTTFHTMDSDGYEAWATVEADLSDMTEITVQDPECGRDFRCRSCGAGGAGPDRNEEPRFEIVEVEE